MEKIQADFYGEAYNLAIESLKEKQNETWIPVSERLPENEGKYLCCTKNGSMVLGKYYIFGNGNRWSLFGSVEKAMVAWKPLPEPYKGE